MAKKKVLITVTTYPLPSRSYDELVCTAGVLENGEWIRIYPVPLKFLSGLRKDGKVESEQQYVNDKKTGPSSYYYDTGELFYTEFHYLRQNVELIDHCRN